MTILRGLASPLNIDAYIAILRGISALQFFSILTILRGIGALGTPPPPSPRTHSPLGHLGARALVELEMQWPVPVSARCSPRARCLGHRRLEAWIWSRSIYAMLRGVWAKSILQQCTIDNT